MKISRQEYWSQLPFPSPGDLPDPGIELASPTLGRFFSAESSGKQNSFLQRGNSWQNIQDVAVLCLIAQWGLILRDPMDCSLPGSSVHGIFQARILGWVAISFSISSYSCHLFYRCTAIVEIDQNK